MAWTTWSCCTPTATVNATARKLVQNTAASRKRRSRRLEPDAGQLACPVLRGRGASNGLPLPDIRWINIFGFVNPVGDERVEQTPLCQRDLHDSHLLAG